MLSVHQGTVIVRASEPDNTDRPAYGDPSARYYVLRDRAALTGLSLRRIASSTDSAGQPDIVASLTPAGARAFHALTAAVAHRGANLAVGAESFYQHFAIIIDGSVATAPLINYHEYPDGVFAASRIQLDAALPRTRANQLADTLRLQTLPLRIRIAPGN